MAIRPKSKKAVHAGLSITHRAIELAIYSPQNAAIEQSFSIPTPDGLFDPERDEVRDPALLKELIAQVLKAVKPKPVLVHLSIPGTLLRMLEMPRMEPGELYLSLSSEAERYKTFDHTEAVVDFAVIDNPRIPANMMQLVLGAVRRDVLDSYFKILRELKVKPHSVNLETLNTLRGLSGTGVLSSLAQQAGPDACWGMIFAEPARVRFSLWQGENLLEFRELLMNTSEFDQAAPNAPVVEDMLEEIRRTTKNEQPVIWLTHQVPTIMEQILSDVLGCPVRPAPTGNAVAMAQPLQLSTIGCAMTSATPFPLALDILEGLKASGGGTNHGFHGSAMTSDNATDSASSGEWLIPAGIAATILGGVITGGLSLMAGMTAGQLPDLQSRLDGAKVEVAGLDSRIQELRKKVELDQTLLSMVDKARIRNQVYVALTRDLQQNIPARLWVQTLKVNDQLEVTGRALSHESVIRFAKSFDASAYTRAVLIDAIQEAKLGGNIVYDFKISGGINLDPSLLNEDPLDPSASTAHPDKKGV